MQCRSNLLASRGTRCAARGLLRTRQRPPIYRNSNAPYINIIIEDSPNVETRLTWPIQHVQHVQHAQCCCWGLFSIVQVCSTFRSTVRCCQILWRTIQYPSDPFVWSAACLPSPPYLYFTLTFILPFTLPGLSY